MVKEKISAAREADISKLAGPFKKEWLEYVSIHVDRRGRFPAVGRKIAKTASPPRWQKGIPGTSVPVGQEFEKSTEESCSKKVKGESRPVSYAPRLRTARREQHGRRWSRGYEPDYEPGHAEISSAPSAIFRRTRP
ncbi:hypothetical protein KM043_010546 [Ampulex compressa]|nr:hypothetical protein KM043_010546 [Ampulex compressa]